MDDRQIVPGDRVILELPGQPMMRPVGLGHHQKAGRILVDPVHDPRPLFAPDPRKGVAAVEQKRVHQRSRRRPRRGVDDHSGGLVDDDEVGILPHDRQGDIFGQRLNRSRRIKPQVIDLTFGHLGLGVGDQHPIPADRPFGDHPHQTRPRQRGFLWHGGGKRLIKAVGRVRADGDGKALAPQFGGFLVLERLVHV